MSSPRRALSLLLLLAGCARDPTPPTGEGTASVPAPTIVPTESVSPEPIDLTKPLCPNGLPAAKTEVTPRADGVEVHVYAADGATRGQVRAAASLLASTDRTELRKAVLADADSPKPTSLATCPLLVAETRMELREAPDGVVVTLRVTRAEAQQEAMRTVVERAGRIEAMRQAPR